MIVVQEEHASHNCKECGCYTDTTITVTRNGAEVARIVSDVHLDGCDFDDYRGASAVAAVLRQLYPHEEVHEA